ncbi:MAG: hypothetical protein ABIJ91_02950 [Candidatus Kuenenbacteria bacterium]
MRILARIRELWHFKEFFNKIPLIIDKGDDSGLKIKNIQYNLITLKILV